MDRNQDQLESMLKSLPTAKPSAELDARIARALAQQPVGVRGTRDASGRDPRPAVIGRIWRVVLAVAAVVIVALLVTAGMLLRSPDNAPGPVAVNSPSNTTDPTTPNTNATSDTQAVPQTATLASAESSYTYAGVVQGADGQPVRVLQRHTVQKWTWIDPETNARVEAQVPQEDVVLVSLAMY